VIDLLRSLPPSFWPRPCKRIRDWYEQGKEPSSNTGGYNQARQALPLSIVQKVCDHIFGQLMAQFGPSSPNTPPAFIFDGTSIRLPHTEALHKAYPPGSNQHGESHWPLLRILVAHDVHTGLAMRPEWGPMHGPDAAKASEQALLEKALDRLPVGAIVMGDANFGVFSVAHTATERRHPVLLRLTPARAHSLAGENLYDGIDREVLWKPSPHERRKHPDLPKDACVRGRLLVQKVQPEGKKPFLLAVFTTLTAPGEEIFAGYGQRWFVETDLRTLKSTLNLDQLTCTTPDMVAKEIEMGITAYNLVRGTIAIASQQSGIPPRGYRFTKVRRLLEAYGRDLATAPDDASAQRIFKQMMQQVQRSKQYPRKRKRPSYPRAVWKRGATFPNRKK
jgi:hypothetical protein